MKTAYKFLFIIALILTSCCQSDNENSDNTDFSSKQWKLTGVQGGIAGFNYQFEEGEIVWTFNNITNTVTVINNNTNEELYDVMETGVYNFQINLSTNPMQCDEALFVDNMELGCAEVIDDKLIISQAYADGFQFIFTQ